MSTWNDHDRKDSAGWICNDVHCTVKWWIAVILHDAVDQVLAVAVESGRPTFRLHYTNISFNQAERDKSTAVIGEGENCLCKCRFVIIRTLQIEPILDLAIEIFPRINQ